MTPRFSSARRRLWLYGETLRYARPRQLLHRARRMVRSRCPWPGRWYDPDGPVPEVNAGNGEPFVAALCDRTPLAGHLERAEDIVERRFTFLTQTVAYQGQVCWQEARHTRLWRFHLHYFDHAVDLGRAFQAKAEARYWERFRALVDDWIAGNPPVRGDGWHPFTISVRLINWTRAFHLFRDVAVEDPAFQRRFLASLSAQARYLARNLEYDITGNHLIKNGTALVFAGAFFQGEESLRWFEQGLRVLVEEAREQILDDGGHYERSPFYHAQVLTDYLDALALIPQGRGERARLVAAVRRMLDFLAAIVHPDGTLPLFNDGALWHEPSPADLWRYAAAVMGYRPAHRPPASNIQAFPNAGYYVLRAADHFFMIDCGPVCPDHLPPHAHCDLLSFELSVGGKRLITNSGTYQYEAGPWRDAFRGTAAHNTVQVDDEEQSAIWGSFRVGRRARVREVVVRQLERGVYLRGCYAGFEGNRLEHRRECFLLPGPCWVVVDTVTWRRGREPGAMSSRLHLPPQVEVECEDGAVQLYRDGVHLRVLPLGKVCFDREPGWFSPALGVKEAGPCLTLRVQGRLPAHAGFVLAPGQIAVSVLGFEAGQGDWCLQLRCEDREYQLASSGAIRC
jgi:hypothetical protein